MDNVTSARNWRTFARRADRIRMGPIGIMEIGIILLVIGIIIKLAAR